MICDTIKELRERTGLSQSALAKKVGVTRSAVNAWEMGLSIPTTQYVAELAQLFHVSADYILNGDSPDNLDPIVNEAIEILNNLKTDKAKKSALEMLRQIQILEG